MEAFAQFASDLDAATKKQLLRGEKLTEVLKQLQYKPLSVAEQISILFAANEGLLDDVENNKKESWTHSHEPSVSSDASFAELRAEALALAVKLITAAYRCLFLSEISREELAEIIGNRSYLSGLDADDPRNLRFPSLLPPQDADVSSGGENA